MRILCLPLDSRPCNVRFVESLVTWAGSEAVFPRPEEMDDYRRPAPREASRAFLLRELPRCDAAVVSLDHWCYGSLLASREEAVSAEEALDRAEALQRILERYAHIPVYLNSVILRSSISTLTQGDLRSYNAMTDYSFFSDRFRQLGDPVDEARAEEARRLIPDVVERALRLRERNLLVNSKAVDMAAAGLARSLCLLQEDCQTYGLPKRDQDALLERLRAKKPRRVFLRNGADEGGAFLAAEALSQSLPPLEAEFVWLGDTGFTAAYEDRPFRDNVESACREMGIVEKEDAETVFLICGPEDGKQREAAEAAERAGYPEACARRADELTATGKRVYLLDVIAANGGCAALIRRLRGADLLWGYSAWNTASNALGVLLAQAVTDSARGKKNEAFFRERLLDDGLYQAIVRQKLNGRLWERGRDVFSLSDRPEAEGLLRRLFSQALPGFWPLDRLPDYEIALPWTRTFEADVRVKAEEP